VRIDKKETKVYPFDELTDEAKETVIQNHHNINVDYGWWEYLYEDAETVLLKISEFDLDRNRHCTGDFIEAADDTAKAILENHGETCDTYQTASEYLEERRKLVEKYSDGITIDAVAKDNEYNFDNECDDLGAEFLQAILEDYSIMLQKEYEYETSEEAIVETIKANEYEFTEDGTINTALHVVWRT